MKQVTHTKGPWYCIGGAVYADNNNHDPQKPIAFMCRAGIPPVERDNNAHLIASVPARKEAMDTNLEAILACTGWEAALSSGDSGNVTEWIGPRLYRTVDILKAF